MDSISRKYLNDDKRIWGWKAKDIQMFRRLNLDQTIYNKFSPFTEIFYYLWEEGKFGSQLSGWNRLEGGGGGEEDGE